jgi:hypothetical protein
VNLCTKNPEFAFDLAAWSWSNVNPAHIWQPAPPVALPVDTIACIEATAAGTLPSARALYNTNEPGGAPGQPWTPYIPATPGLTYCASAYILGAAGSPILTPWRLALSFWSAALAVLPGGTTSPSYSGAGAWQRIATGGALAPALTAYAMIEFDCRLFAAEQYWATAFQVEPGAVPSPYENPDPRTCWYPNQW